VPADITRLLPESPPVDALVERAGYAPLVVTMSHGDELAAAVTARAVGKRRVSES
jgi:hypothetical protein